ncbi:hypothetical protein LOAG_10055 [Loa loa]|uniref:Uncharacterized protein n=1 Tax=Loa loa TaxID=7209 RepID=A0A1S0TQJ0_LOALO|nr:hypothetical protein LOAG_10055 [Loa loa]EFO18439.1 hypothetical protein LOAG_10055 [Loa loa]
MAVVDIGECIQGYMSVAEEMIDMSVWLGAKKNLEIYQKITLNGQVKITPNEFINSSFHLTENTPSVLYKDDFVNLPENCDDTHIRVTSFVQNPKICHPNHIKMADAFIPH